MMALFGRRQPAFVIHLVSVCCDRRFSWCRKGAAGPNSGQRAVCGTYGVPLSRLRLVAKPTLKERPTRRQQAGRNVKLKHEGVAQGMLRRRRQNIAVQPDPA